MQLIVFYAGDDDNLQQVGDPELYLDGDGRIMQGVVVVLGSSPGGAADLGMMQPVLFALSLLHCKNVTTEDQPATPAKVAKKRRERGIRDVQFKTLVVKPMRQRLRSEGKGEGPAQALHFVRAHFKAYTAEAPLFGKHVGRYFWGMHAAGSSEQGTVVKGYKLKPK